MAKNNRKLKVDMTGVESFNRCPEGEWLARLKKAEMGEVQGSGDDALKVQFEVIKGAAKGSIVFETFSLSEKALWKLKSFLEAAGMNAKGKLTLDLDKLEGKTCIIEVIHDEYNGVKRAKISSYINPSDDEDDDDADDEDDEEDEDEAPKKKSKSAAPAKKGKKKPEPEEDEDDEDEDEDDEDEEEEPPKKSKKAKKPEKKSSKKSGKKSKDEDEDEDDEDDWEEDD